MKKTIIALLLSCLFVAPALAQEAADSISVTPEELAERIIQEAKKHLGKPYRWAGNGPSSFDCSGFTKYVYKQFGYNLPRVAGAQAEEYRAVLGDMSSLQKGDLVFFSSNKHSNRIGHVGIFMELTEDGRDFLFIHSAGGGVQITKLSEPYYLERFRGAVRVIPDFIILDDEKKVSGGPASAPAEEEFENVVVPQYDTLQLAVNDRRIVLFGDGRWVYVDAEGKVVVPDEADRIVLCRDGSWTVLKASEVRIPSIVETNASAAAETAEENAAQYYTVKSGDSLGKIAARYHTTVQALCRLNNMRSTDILKIGRRLRVK